MPNHTVRVRRPMFYKDFACIGPDCSDNCCHTWEIEIDKAHYLRYRKEKNPEFAALCARTVHRKKKDATENAYARLSLDAQGRCGFQDEDGGCKLYRLLGPDALSRTCALYPRRKTAFFPQQWELSLSMSCGEAVQLGVLQPERVDFETVELTVADSDSLWQTQATGIGQGGRTAAPPAYGQALRDGCIRLIQCRKYTVAERIMAVILLMKRVDRLAAGGNGSQIPAQVEGFLSSVESGGFAGFFDRLDYHREAHLAAMQAPLGHMLSGRQGDIPQKLLRHMTPYLEPDGNGEPCAGLKAVQFLLDQVQQRADPFWEAHQVWMENYFVNYLFSSMFPFLYRAEGIGFEAHGHLLAEQYALLRLTLAVLAGNEAEANQALASRAFVYVARLSQHGDLGQDMKQLFQALHIHGTAHAAYLLR